MFKIQNKKFVLKTICVYGITLKACYKIERFKLISFVLMCGHSLAPL